MILGLKIVLAFFYREDVSDFFNSPRKHDNNNDMTTREELGWASSFATALANLRGILS